MRTARNCPTARTRVAFSAGFVIATGLLHLTGISFGLLARWPAGRLAVRGGGRRHRVVGVAYLGGFDDREPFGGLVKFFTPSHVLRSRHSVCWRATGKRKLAVTRAAFALGLLIGSIMIATAVRETPAATVLLGLAAFAGLLSSSRDR